MSDPRIVIFSALYMPHLGGVEKFSQSIAAELSHTSRVTVFCMNTEKQPGVVREGEVEVHFLPCFPLLKGRFPVPKPSAIRYIKNWLEQNPVDFGIVQCRFYLLSLLGCLMLGKKKIPFIQIEHGAGEVIMPGFLVRFLWNFYDRTLTFFEKRVPHDFYAVSHAGLRWLEHYGIQGSGVISNSIAPQDFQEALANPHAWRHQHQISDDKLIITFTGRIMEEKGILDLLEAYERVRGENLLLAVAGGGDTKLIERWLGREDILFTGQLPFQEIPFLLADTAIFCLPSHFVEGKPTGVLEAGYCRNAVIATGSGGTIEVIPDEQYGKLITAGDVAALTEALQDLIDHPEKREAMGSRLRERIEEMFTWKTAAEGVHKAMRKYDL